MDKDSLLKQNEVKLIILICGDSKTGKKTIVKQIIGDRKSTIKEYEKYTSYFFNSDEFLGTKSMIKVPVEIRVLNSDELETELKSNKQFFNDALGAFVVTSITDNNSFINGEKWKDKIDLMCCLPNRFPLPIILLINKYDEILNNKVKESDLQYSQKDKIENYALSNQFFNAFLIVENSGTENINNKKIHISDSEKSNNIIDQSIINQDSKDKDNIIVEAEDAFKVLLKIIMGFKEIKNAFISQGGGEIDNADLIGNNYKENKKCIIY
jgi:hypothetical protein